MTDTKNSITVNAKCTCGFGDAENTEKKYYENVCPSCGREGTLVLATKKIESSEDESKTNTDEELDTTDNTTIIVRCDESKGGCGAEYCGQDGFDLRGGTRGKLGELSEDEVAEGDEEVSTEDERDSKYMSGWEGLCDLLRPLDAEAMILQRGDYVIVRKITMPQSARLWAYEGINVVDDSVTITDYTPEIYNTFVIRWGESMENELEFVFQKHKNLFGERKIVLEAKKEVPVGSEEASEGEEEDKEEDSSSWSISDLLFGGNDDDKKTDEQKVDKVLGQDSTTDSDEEQETEEVNITTKEEAKQFGMKQVGKAKRSDGHTIELKVIGNQKWQMGEWCHVRLPSFNEDCYMFISKCSFESSADSEYINTLTLVDYPPTLGLPQKKDEKEEDTSSEENKTDENATEDGTNTDSTTGTDSTNTGGNTTTNG